MQHTVQEPLGVVVTGLDLRSPSRDRLVELEILLARHGVAVLPDQELDDGQFLDFLRRLGQPVFTTGETPVEGHPDLNVVSNIGRTTPPRSQFHVDSSYLSRPPTYTALRAVRIPEQGGETLFTDQYAAHDALPAEQRERLAGRTVRHVVTGLELGDDDETEAEHPLFWEHPLSGRTALYLSTPQRCVSISGLDEEESRATVLDLYEHSTSAQITFRHTWSPGDVVIWDNRCVMHRADHSGVVGDRVMHRGMVLA
jgi:taurine dioxygenase